MKVVFTTANYDSKLEEEVELILEYEGEDTWTLKTKGIDVTINGLTPAMEFLEEMRHQEEEDK